MNARIALGVALVLVLLAATYLVARRGEGGEVPPPAASAAGDQALLAVLGELSRAQERTADALERLERRLADRPAAPGADQREPLPGAGLEPGSFEELLAALEAMRGAIELESRRTRELLRDAGVPGAGSLRDAGGRSTTPDWAALADLERAWRGDPEEADRSQYFQTVRDLLETYGRPTAIYRPQNGMLFHYRRHPEGAAGPSWYFRLQDGMAVEFWVEDDGEEESP